MRSPPHRVSQKAAEVLGDTALMSWASIPPPLYQHWYVLHTGARLSWQLMLGGASPIRRKEIAATNYNFAIINLLALIWPIFTLIHAVLNREGLKFTKMSSTGRVNYFLGFIWQRVDPTSGEEAWPRQKLHGESASLGHLCPHVPKVGHCLPFKIHHPLQQQPDPQP